MEFNDADVARMVANRDSDGLSRLSDDIDREIKKIDENLQVVEKAHNSITKELVILRNTTAQKRQEQLDYEAKIKEGHFLLRTKKTEKAIVTRAFWRAK